MEPSRNTLTVMGDSIAVGLGDAVPGHVDLPWADQLAQAVCDDPEVDYRNLGVVGARLHEIVSSQLDLAVRPTATVTVVTGGGNDVLGRSVEWAQLERELDRAVGRLCEAGSRVVTFGLFDVSCTHLIPQEVKKTMRARIQRLNEITAMVTARHHGCFVDFFDHPQQSARLFSADGLHPNRRAHEIITAEVRDALFGSVAGPRATDARRGGDRR